MTLELWTRKVIDVESSLSYYVGAWKIRILKTGQTVEAWLVKIQREAKMLLGSKDPTG